MLVIFLISLVLSVTLSGAPKFFEILYLICPVIVFMCYYNNKVQYKVWMLSASVYFAMRPVISYTHNKYIDFINSTGFGVFTIGDVTLTTDEYITWIGNVEIGLLLLVTVTVFSVIELIYLSLEVSKLSKRYNEEGKGFYNEYNTKRDRMYSTRVFLMLYSTISIIILGGSFSPLNVNRMIGTQALIVYLLYTTVGWLHEKELMNTINNYKEKRCS